MSASGCSSWPTPGNGDDRGASPGLEDAIARHKAKGQHKQVGLRDAAPMWPTPHTSLDKGAGHRNPEKGANLQTVALSLWPTASARDWKGATDEPWGGNARPLNEVAKTWPTPDVPNGGRAMRPGATRTGVLPDGRKAQVGLENVAAAWPTPRACSGERSSGLNRTEMVEAWQGASRPGRKKSLSSLRARGIEVRGRRSLNDPQRLRRPSLNPFFVEWLMGWPLGWTVCGSPVTGWSLWLQRQRTALCELSWNYEPAPGAEPDLLQMELL